MRQALALALACCSLAWCQLAAGQVTIKFNGIEEESIDVADGVTPVYGRILLPEGSRLHPDTEIRVTTQTGAVLVTFPVLDGRFEVPEVPDGTSRMEVLAPGWVFPTIKLVTGLGSLDVHAEVPELPGSPKLKYPLLVRPLTRAQYWEVKKPFNVIAFLKTPYGMMGAFMLFSMFILPRMKVDPEEYRQVMGAREGGSGSRGGGGERGRRD